MQANFGLDLPGHFLTMPSNCAFPKMPWHFDMKEKSDSLSPQAI